MLWNDQAVRSKAAALGLVDETHTGITVGKRQIPEKCINIALAVEQLAWHAQPDCSA